MRECLKITIQELNSRGNIRGFFGTLCREDGKTIVKEKWDISKQWLIEDLGSYAKWYNENILNEKEETKTTPRIKSSEKQSSESN